jgi:mRNA interferase MazF
MSSGRVDKGDVVLVDIPYLDAKQVVKRPALVISDSSQMLDIVVAGITSRIRAPLPPTHYVIDNSHADWQASGLRLTSAIRCDRIFTVEHVSIHRVLGRLTPPTLLDLDRRLKLALGIA